MVLASNRPSITSEQWIVRNVLTKAHDRTDRNDRKFASTLGCFTTVALEQSTKSLVASDVTQSNRIDADIHFLTFLPIFKYFIEINYILLIIFSYLITLIYIYFNLIKPSFENLVLQMYFFVKR